MQYFQKKDHVTFISHAVTFSELTPFSGEAPVIHHVIGNAWTWEIHLQRMFAECHCLINTPLTFGVLQSTQESETRTSFPPVLNISKNIENGGRHGRFGGDRFEDHMSVDPLSGILTQVLDLHGGDGCAFTPQGKGCEGVRGKGPVVTVVVQHLLSMVLKRAAATNVDPSGQGCHRRHFASLLLQAGRAGGLLNHYIF